VPSIGTQDDGYGSGLQQPNAASFANVRHWVDYAASVLGQDYPYNQCHCLDFSLEATTAPYRHWMRQLTDEDHPVTIRDDARFETLVKAWKYSGTWQSFSQVYESKPDIPVRLQGFTIIANNDPNEPYGALLQVTPPQAQADSHSNYAGRKLLAKIRLD